MTPSLLLLFAFAIHSDFEAASIGEVKRIGPNHYQCALEGETDQDGRNRQATWYYFRLDAPPGEAAIIDLVNIAGEYNYQPNSGGVNAETPPVISYDRKTWRHLTTVEFDPSPPRLRLRLTPERTPVWIAHVPPYTTADLAALLADLGGTPYMKREAIAKTPEGRDMLLLTVTDPSVPDPAKKVTWLMFRQHSWESGTSWVGEGALRFLLSAEDEAARIRKAAVFKIFPMADPDGVARGGVRFNAKGYDLNRNWDAVDPALMPEIASQRKAVLDWVDGGKRIDLFLSLHNTETSEYLDGPPAEPGGAYDRLLNRFFGILKDETSFNPTRPPRLSEATTTAGKRGRMSVYQGLYHDRRIPAFLMEQMIASNSKLGGFPTVEHRVSFGAELVKAAFKAVDGEF
ncbi:MAG: hypothetical protein KIT09_17020 [Bryobacteraceae bacterium]|nr:hypothetical protein [Bryobacteraceae bacterium]